MPRFLLMLLCLLFTCLSAQEVFINEIRANDEGTDDAEFIELIGPAGFDVSDWSIVHFNGTGGSAVFSFVFPEGSAFPDTGFQDPDGRQIAFIVLKHANHTVPNATFDWGTTGLQNGPDGIELLDNAGNRIQALTWNGTGDLVDGDPVWRNVGSDGNDDRSLCAPGNVAESFAAAWDYLEATPGSLNLNQTAEDISLPVQLLSFTAQSRDRVIILRWQTAAEVDNMGFIINRSQSEAGPFETIASYQTDPSLEGAGNSSTPRNYIYEDRAVLNGTTYWYQLLDVDLNGHETVQKTVSATAGETGTDNPAINPAKSPSEYRLYQNYPNPFNPDTRIDIDIPKDTNADLSIFDILGKKIVTLFTGKIEARTHAFYWNGKDAGGNFVPSGIYFYVLCTRDYTSGRRMLFLR